MNKRKIALFSGVTLVALLMTGVVGVGVVAAQEPPPAPPAPLGDDARHPAWRWLALARGIRWEMFDVVADALGLTPVELFTELHDGKTLVEVAEQQGVEMDEVREQVNAARLEMQKQVIEQAVEDGRLSRERADWLIEGLENGFVPRWRPPRPWRRQARQPEGA